MNDETCEIYFARHGETDWNAQGLLQGHADIPLNERGRLQAEELSEHLQLVDFTSILSSDLSRAMETAQIVNLKRSAKIITTPHLRERFLGSFEGKSVLDFNLSYEDPFFESKAALTKTNYLNTPWHEEIETTAAIYSRVLNYLRAYLKNYPQKTLFVSSHGGVVRALLDHLDFIPKRRWIVSNCAYIKFVIRLDSVNLVETFGIHSKQY